MSSAAWPGVVAVVAVSLATLALGTFGLRFSRTTSDFLVASRSVRPGVNASAISGEYLSAASFLGVAGLLLTFGADMVWYPVGWTAGYVVLLALVAAPLRRSGAYTLPDFAEVRLGSRPVRTLCSTYVVGIGWLYLVPQFVGAGVALRAALGTPLWVGPAVVGSVVLANVVSGGMRSITVAQAFQYWLKLTALLVPAVWLAAAWWGDGRPHPSGVPDGWSDPLAAPGGLGAYTTYSLLLGLVLGTMGLPHVVVRYYTNPDGRAARRTTLVVLALLGLFYLLPPVYAGLGRVYAPDLARTRSDTLVLELPRRVLDGAPGDVLTGLVVAGALAAFLGTSSGLSIAIAGVLGQDLTPRLTLPGGRRLRGVAALRAAAVVAVAVPAALATLAPEIGVARVVGLAFAVAASTFAPLLVLGIWWGGLTARGAAAGLVVGGLSTGTAVVVALARVRLDGWPEALLAQPAAWSVPLAVLTMLGVSLADRHGVPAHTRRVLVRLHTPERLDLDRG